MSFQATVWALEQRLIPTDKLVLLCLAHHAGFNQDCWPSIATLERETNLSRSTLVRVMTRLREHGLISRERTKRADGGYGANRYNLLIPPSVTVTLAPSVKNTPPSVTADTSIRIDNRTKKEDLKFHVKEGSPQWRAWSKHLGKQPPIDKNFGWFLPSEWPPN